ncbi:hypothetical protein TEA_023511 [Camellia sinensis var. sinensis]|uniref:UDP-glycosyltransferase n=1 Tax=Camellia sinensis var. sinensis TaxID=542762 RepID=A0A4S4DYC5_CAMSN|nr:hypothetical protein TEA_023511 [Camellia sinensis var. sinensis]
MIFISKFVLLPPFSPLTQIYKIHLVLDRSIEEHRIIASKPQLKSPSQPQLKLQSSQQQSGPQPQLQLQPQEKCQSHPKHVQGSYVRPPGPRLVSKNRYGYEITIVWIAGLDCWYGMLLFFVLLVYVVIEDMKDNGPCMKSMTNPSMETADKLHVVMFPWLAFGHMIPFLELSKVIAQKGHTVSFVCTRRNIDRLPKLPPNLAPLINLVKLQLHKVDKLPDNAESTIDLPYDEVKYLKMAYDQLQQPMTQILADLAPDWVIYDFAPYWLGPIATKLGISSVFFSVTIAISGCFLGPVQVLKGLSGEDDRNTPEDFTVRPKWIPFKSNIAYRLFEIKRIFEDVATANDENVPVSYRFGAGIEACDVLAVRSSYELEPEWLKLLQEIHQKPIIPVG